jgi:hypothetical protein
MVTERERDRQRETGQRQREREEHSTDIAQFVVALTIFLVGEDLSNQNDLFQIWRMQCLY